MGALTYSDLIALDLGRLNTAVTDWETMVGHLARLRTEARDGLLKKSEGARWQGVNATVTKDFVRSAAKEFDDLFKEAQSVHNVLADAHAELSQIQKRAKALTEEARKGGAGPHPDAEPALLVMDGGNGTVKVIEAVCDVEGTSQRTKDRMQWYADTLTGLVAHAAEIDAAVTRALRKSHGGDPHNAGHATYTSLDEDQLPRAMKLASLGEDANAQQRAELRRLWQSLSPEARGQLWAGHRDDLLAAGLLMPASKRIAADSGAGAYGVESPTARDQWIQTQAVAMSNAGDFVGNTDAASHMDHYLRGLGTPVDLDVDRMFTDDAMLRQTAEYAIQDEQERWREQALAEFEKSGGQPVAFPVETPPQGYTHSDRNWYLAVGSGMTNTTGTVTVVPGENGEPKISLDYQVNVWDRYNWDPGKTTPIGPTEVTDADMARLHTTGLAREFDMRGSGSVQHHDLSSNGGLPAPEAPGRDGTRSDPGRNGDAR
ncbi:hypothetical protein [Streptomyces deccanensis]|uniref:hypothetical protein n=1 Tax=Streptomyces deccanensis TaxID=424188 RepID=UPI001EFAB8C8|nr:hypothetical protein [Streptomyces deccanensis]ULR54652.1 hypothetical protein L3078_38210 [Streptomyces deccanensis]